MTVRPEHPKRVPHRVRCGLRSRTPFRPSSPLPNGRGSAQARGDIPRPPHAGLLHVGTPRRRLASFLTALRAPPLLLSCELGRCSRRPEEPPIQREQRWVRRDGLPISKLPPWVPSLRDQR